VNNSVSKTSGGVVQVRSLGKRVLALPAAAAGAMALVAVGAGAAHAAAITGGSVTLTVKAAWVAQLAKAGVVVVPQGDSSLTYNAAAKTFSVTFAATGGDADLNLGAGSVDYSGSLLGFSCKGRTVSLGSLLFDLENGQFDGASAAGGELALADLGGTVDGTISGTTQTFESSDLDLDPAGAAYLDSALGTKAFTAGQSIGSFSATWSR
jgi:hypothetical protein